MNEAEAGTILGIAAGFDRYIVLNPLNTAAWFSVLAEHEFADVKEAVIEYYRSMWDGKTQLAPHVLLDDVKTKIASDVRVARRANLIPSSWPDDKRVTSAVSRDIDVYRAALDAWNRANPIGFNHHETFAEFCASNGFRFETKPLEVV